MSSFSYISPLSNSSYLAVAVLGPLAVSSLSVPVSEHAPRRQCLYIDCERAPHSAAFSWSAISPHSQKSTLSYRNSRDLLAELFIRQALSHVMPSVYYFPFVKIISPENFVGFTENAKINAIGKDILNI